MFIANIGIKFEGYNHKFDCFHVWNGGGPFFEEKPFTSLLYPLFSGCWSSDLQQLVTQQMIAGEKKISNQELYLRLNVNRKQYTTSQKLKNKVSIRNYIEESISTP